MISALHHVQLAMPGGGESLARSFYAGVLGFREVAKPAALDGRGGLWFEAGVGGSVRLHLGVAQPFVPAEKAHPAFAVTDLAELRAHLDGLGVAHRAGVELPGLARIYVSDPFGNRIEFLEDMTQP